jgi:transposase
VLIIGEAERFESGKPISSYLGLVPEEGSSGKGVGWDKSANRVVG